MKNIYLFHGQDSYTSINKSFHWKSEFEKKYGDLNTEILEGFDLTSQQFNGAINTLPFLSEKKFILIKNAFSESDSEELKAIAENIESAPDHCVVVFIETNNADKRTSLYKAIKKHGQVMEFNPPDEHRLVDWIGRETATNGGIMNPRGASHLAQTVGPNLWQLKSEIEKLTVFADGREITAADIDELSCPNLEVSIFTLTDHLGQKKCKESLFTLKKMIDSGVNLIPLLHSVAGHFRTLIQMKECLQNNMNRQQIITKTKKHPFVVNKTLSQCKNFTPEALKHIYNRFLETDIALKTSKIHLTTGDQSELRLAIEKIIADFCSQKHQSSSTVR